ncbi:MinD/ParA family ATP-binding protein [Streptomyces sp. bgisy034]|uniref:MinD/ParA family ATP-binding protein n=1 Tax=Streptomyces sp. bgisy034 TaxID=3413774 RepID=UPI003EBA8621
MRRLIALGSLAGAPGVTTTALALAAAWPQGADGGVRPVVVEANVWGGDLATRCGAPHTPGLLDVAAAARQPQPGSLLGAVADLPFGVRAVVAPAGRGACGEAVRVLAAESGRRVLRGEAGDRGTVLLDVGRIIEDVEGLLSAVDHVMLVTRGCPEALTHFYAHLLSVDEEARQITLVVVGPCPFPAEEITQALGVQEVVFLPWDVRTMAAMRSQRRITLRTSGFGTRPLMAAAHLLARQISKADESAEVPERAGVVRQMRAALVDAPGEGSGA